MSKKDITGDLAALKRANELTILRHPYDHNGYVTRPDLAHEWRDGMVERLIEARESYRLLLTAKRVSEMMTKALKSPTTLHEREIAAHLLDLRKLLGEDLTDFGISSPPNLH